MAFSLSKTRSRRKTPKEKPDRRKPRKAIPARSKFRAHTNPIKPCREVPIDTLMMWAREKQRIQLEADWPSERNVAAILRDMGEKADRQEIFVCQPTFLLRDFNLRARKLVIEVDGAEHLKNFAYDIRCDRYLANVGIRTLRIPNRVTFKPMLCRQIIQAELDKRTGTIS